MPPRIAQHRRAFALHDLKALDDTAGTFSGYLAVFSNEDLGGDVIEPGAFAKTLNDARERKATHNSNYLFPILYQHNEQAPCGGFMDAHEDNHGLYVKGQLDLDTTLGRETYSGLKKGYLSGLSIGYSAVKHKWVGDVRHLQELALYEGSVVTFPMNPEAQVSAVKGASGKADWPLGARDAAWDNGAAHKRIVQWATKDDGSVDTGKLKSVHFYSPDGDATENISEYKLLFCDVVGGDVKAMPKGIEACAGSHGVNNTTGISADEKATIRNKISAYYTRMAKAFDDDSIVAPWDADKSTQNTPVRKARDFNTAFQALAQSDQLQDDWGDTWQAIVTAISDIMWQAKMQMDYPDMMGAGETIDPVEAVQSNLDAFNAAVIDLVKRSVAADFAPCLDNDGDSFYDPDGPNADDDDDMGYMSAGSLAEDVKAFRARKESKEGRAISAGNHQMMRQAVDMIGMGHKALSQFLADNDPAVNDPAVNDPATASTSRTTTDAGKGDANDLNNPGNIPPVATDNIYDPGFGKAHHAPRRKPSFYHYAPRAGAQPARRDATTLTTRAGAQDDAGRKATTHDGADTTTTAETMDDVARFRALMASIRQGAQAQHNGNSVRQ